MFLTSLLNRVFPERIARAPSAPLGRAVRAQEMQRILARERERADRSGGHFLLLVFSVAVRVGIGKRWRSWCACCDGACGGRTRPAGSIGAASAWCCPTRPRRALGPLPTTSVSPFPPT